MVLLDLGRPATQLKTTLDAQEGAIMMKVIVLSIIGLMCWIVMFLAGHDVRHFAGSPDFWRLNGPPNDDLRAIGYAFYLQFFIFICVITIGIWSNLKGNARRMSFNSWCTCRPLRGLHVTTALCFIDMATIGKMRSIGGALLLPAMRGTTCPKAR